MPDCEPELEVPPVPDDDAPAPVLPEVPEELVAPVGAVDDEAPVEPDVPELLDVPPGAEAPPVAGE